MKTRDSLRKRASLAELKKFNGQQNFKSDVNLMKFAGIQGNAQLLDRAIRRRMKRENELTNAKYDGWEIKDIWHALVDEHGEVFRYQAMTMHKANKLNKFNRENGLKLYWNVKQPTHEELAKQSQRQQSKGHAKQLATGFQEKTSSKLKPSEDVTRSDE